MSGWVGLVHGDGEPVNLDLLRRLTATMAFRGPDAQESWCEGPVGLGHALLRVTPEEEGRTQPATLDGTTWIVGHLRIDGQRELRSELRARGRTGLDGCQDAGLVLHAYAVWGEACVEHLLGDFSFVLWDAERRRLFGARDHFGVRPFYYAFKEGKLLVGNTADTLRAHPLVSDELNEFAIADFLLFGYNQEPETTAFVDLRRLPPAHTLSWSLGEGEPRVRRYWALPIDGPLQLRRPQDYVERFLELFTRAVEDRLRTDRVSIWMSGGLDSTSIAAVAHRLLGDRPFGEGLAAVTAVYEKYFPEYEREYAGLMAKSLGIPISYMVASDHPLFAARAVPAAAEPTDLSLHSIPQAISELCSQHSRVSLRGYGPDAWLSPALDVPLDLLKRGRWLRLAILLGWFTYTRHRLPKLGFRSSLRRRYRPEDPPRPVYPHWVDPEFERRTGLRERWAAGLAEPPPIHPHRPEAYSFTEGAFWPSVFNSDDSEITGLPLEFRCPFFDTRLVRYALSLPSVPWCYDKEILRRAMRGMLPEEIRRRPKATLPGDPWRARLEERPLFWSVPPSTTAARFLRLGEVPSTACALSGRLAGPTLWTFSLCLWLSGLDDGRPPALLSNEHEEVRLAAPT